MTSCGIVLAAGRGIRLGSMTRRIPKCMVLLLGRPLLTWQLAAMRLAGVRRITTVVGYKKGKVPRVGRQVFNRRWRSTSIVRSLFSVGNEVSGAQVVTYSDIVYAPSAVSALLRCRADIAITYDVNWLHLWQARFADILSDAECFGVDKRGYLQRIGGRAASVHTIEGQFMGLLRISPTGWRTLVRLVKAIPRKDADKLDTTALLQRAIQAGIRIRAIPYSGPWAEVDNARDLVLYETHSRFKNLRVMLRALLGAAATHDIERLVRIERGGRL